MLTSAWPGSQLALALTCASQEAWQSASTLAGRTSVVQRGSSYSTEQPPRHSPLQLAWPETQQSPSQPPSQPAEQVPWHVPLHEPAQDPSRVCGGAFAFTGSFAGARAASTAGSFAGTAALAFNFDRTLALAFCGALPNDLATFTLDLDRARLNIHVALGGAFRVGIHADFAVGRGRNDLDLHVAGCLDCLNFFSKFCGEVVASEAYVTIEVGVAHSEILHPSSCRRR